MGDGGREERTRDLLGAHTYDTEVRKWQTKLGFLKITFDRASRYYGEDSEKAQVAWKALEDMNAREPMQKGTGTTIFLTMNTYGLTHRIIRIYLILFYYIYTNLIRVFIIYTQILGSPFGRRTSLLPCTRFLLPLLGVC